MSRMRAALLALILIFQVPGIVWADVPANIPLNRSFYVYIEGPVFGMAGPELYANWIEGLWLEHSVYFPTDPVPGSSHRPVHTGLSFVKRFDRTSPLLFKAFANATRQPKVKIDFTRLDPKSGGQVPFMRIELFDVFVIRIREFTQGAQLLEEVVLMYRQMEITNIEKGTQWKSSWPPPPSPT